MKHRLRLLGSVLLLVTALLILCATQVWAEGPGGVGDDGYIVQLKAPDDEAEAAETWFRTERILSSLQARGLVQRFEIAEKESTAFVATGQEGLRQLQKLAWVTRIEQQTDRGLTIVYDAQAVELASKASPTAPNVVSGIVDLPDGTPVQYMEVHADEPGGWGGPSDLTDASGMYSLTLGTDGWWDIYLGSVPFPHSTNYARPLDWKRRLYLTSDSTQDFTLVPISYTITGTVRMTDTGALMQNVQVNGDRTDNGHSDVDWTDLNGLYELDVTSGTYTLTLAKAWSSMIGYAPPFEFVGERVPVPGASVGDVDLWVWPMDKVISGTVTDKDTGAPIGNALLDLYRTDGLYTEYNIGTEASGLTGTYAVSVTSGVYRVSLDTWSQPTGYALPLTTTQVVTVTDSNVTDVDFQLLPANKSISGRVTVQGTNTGVAGVRMRLTPNSTYTNTTASGYYTFTDLPEGDYTIYVYNVPAGYAKTSPTSRQVEVTTTNRSGIDFEVLAADKTIRGTVREAGGSGIAGVDVYAYAYDSGYPYDAHTTTDVSGTYTVAVPPGTFNVNVTLPNGYAGPSHLRAPDGANGVDFDLYRQSQTITGQVTDHEGTPLANVDIYAENYDCYEWDWGGYGADATTNASGYYTLTVLPGTYEIQAYKTGYPTPPYQDAQGGDSGVDFAMPEGFYIRGQVWTTAPGGGTLVLPGAFVSAYNTAECASGRHNQSTSADANGYYTLTVGAGTYAVSASSWQHTAPPAQSVTVGPNQDSVNFEMSPKTRYAVTGTVRYADGQPTTDGYVYVDEGPEYDSDWFSSGTDVQYQLYLVPGTYDLAVWMYNWPDPDIITGVVVMTDTGGVDFTAPAAYTVSGTVRENDGTPLDDVSVYADEQGPPYETDWDWTDADGTYALHVRQGGTYEFYPSSREASPPSVVYTVTADMTGVDFQYGAVVTVTGMVSDTFGNPLPNAEIYLNGQGTNGAWNWEDTYSFYDGTYVGFLATGSYSGRAEKEPCYVDDRQSFALGAGGASDVDFTLARMCSAIAGRVTGPQGAGVCGADVEIWYPGVARLDEVYTAEDWHGPAGIGTYRAWVPIGTWELMVSKEGYANPIPLTRTVEITSCGMLVPGQDFQFATSETIYLPIVLRNS
jgi:protocatechuate 3,4-dioxygenase beta subunit